MIKASGCWATTYAYNPSKSNQLASTTTSGVATYYYDQSGHVTSISPYATNYCPTLYGSCLSYDAQGRLSKVAKASGLTVTMSYNATGQRMSYTATGGGANLSEQFQYRGGELAQVTTTGTQSTTDTYLYRRDGTPYELVRTQAGVTSRYWYEVDGRANVIALTDLSGNTVDRYSYDLWGKLVSSSETVPQRLRYTGSWYDQELGWYWLGSRVYDPTLERFLQPDPSQTEGIFTYVYAGDDPVDYNDKSGMSFCPMNAPDGICPVKPSGAVGAPPPVNNNTGATGTVYTWIAPAPAPAPAPIVPAPSPAPPPVRPAPPPYASIPEPTMPTPFSFVPTQQSGSKVPGLASAVPPDSSTSEIEGDWGLASLTGAAESHGQARFDIGLKSNRGVIDSVKYDIYWQNLTTGDHGIIRNGFYVSIPFITTFWIDVPIPNFSSTFRKSLGDQDVSPGIIRASLYFTAEVLAPGIDPVYFTGGTPDEPVPTVTILVKG